MVDIIKRNSFILILLLCIILINSSAVSAYSLSGNGSNISQTTDNLNVTTKYVGSSSNVTINNTTNIRTSQNLSNSTSPVGNNTTKYFNVTQVKRAATDVKIYIETYNKLPANINISGTKVNMSQFLELLVTATLRVNSGNSSKILLRNFTAPTNPIENIHSGTINKTEYIKIAGDIKRYMDSTGKTPDFAYNTSLGTYLRFENLVYMYSKILNSNNTTYLPNSVAVRPWNMTKRPIITKFTIYQILVAATNIRSYIETNKRLPDFIQISNINITMSQFLELSTRTLLQINVKNNNTVPLYNSIPPKSRRDDIRAGNIYKSEYLHIATDVRNYMDSTGITPDFAYQTSLGNYLGYWNLVYMYSMILDYYHTSGKLADFAIMGPWNILGTTDYGNVEKLGPFGNFSSPIKIAYIVGVHPLEYNSHKALIETLEDNNSILKYCYYIYKVTVTKDANDYDKGRMNGQLLANRFAVPDIIKERFNLTIDVHSNVGNWQYTKFVFSPVPGTQSESIARTVKNQLGWLTYYVPPNPTSTYYITIPLIQAGISAFVYEVYGYDTYSKIKEQAYQLIIMVNRLFN